MNLPPWQPEALTGILAIMLCTLGFTAYHFLSLSPRIKNRYAQKYGQEKGHTRHIFFQRYIGMLCIGLLPALVMWLVTGNGLADFGVPFENTTTSLLWILGLGVLIILINYFNTQNPKNLAFYPMIREKVWSRKLVMQNALSWIAYLVGYELMFRGILLFGLVPLLGVWPAIAVNAALYAFAHIPKNLGETIGAIPLGVLFCLLTLHTGTIWIALIVHIIIALSNSFFSLRAHPDMKLAKHEGGKTR
jgi:membrane protease YdiL (CAAX protease family)